MDLYIQKDLDKFKEEKENIILKHTKAKLDLIEPTKKEIKAVMDIIIEFIKKHKRKIYGGYALNLLIKSKNKDDVIYKEEDLPDIDFYSPEPIIDLIEICNDLHKKKFKHINGIEAVHKETYSIKVNQQLYCDITYMPKILYNVLPYKEIDGIHVAHPHFIEIDYLRMINDPLVSYWRIDKIFPRLFKLQKHYPFPHSRDDLIVLKTKNQEILDDVFEWIKDKKSIIVIGQYAFSYYLMKSEINKRNFKILDIPMYEFISTNYRDDVVDLLKILQKKYKATITEHFPFFQFIGYSSYIYLDDKLMVKIYDYNNHCYPYIDIDAYYFKYESFEKTKGFIRIGTFSMTLMYNLICMTKARIDNDLTITNYYYIMASQLVEMRRYYLDKYKKTIFDDTDFKDFEIKCIGEEVKPEIERQIRIKRRKEKGKLLSFKYNPEEGVKEPVSEFKFSNTSGNPIKVSKKMKIV